MNLSPLLLNFIIEFLEKSSTLRIWKHIWIKFECVRSVDVMDAPNGGEGLEDQLGPLKLSLTPKRWGLYSLNTSSSGQRPITPVRQPCQVLLRVTASLFITWKVEPIQVPEFSIHANSELKLYANASPQDKESHVGLMVPPISCLRRSSSKSLLSLWWNSSSFSRAANRSTDELWNGPHCTGVASTVPWLQGAECFWNTWKVFTLGKTLTCKARQCQCLFVKQCESESVRHSVVSDSLRSYGL